ncbi:MAG: hypothetical protein LBJ59_05930 [Zoogloeaceae bacterium]|nr:hypothetical protein [Zoogloeaceae bacterium]
MLERILRRFSAGVFMLIFAFTVHAQELNGTLKRIKESGVINLGYREASIPFSYLDTTRLPIGYAVELCDQVVKTIKTRSSIPVLNVKLIFPGKPSSPPEARLPRNFWKMTPNGKPGP